jgi:hypothetical protein
LLQCIYCDRNESQDKYNGSNQVLHMTSGRSMVCKHYGNAGGKE